MEKVGENTPLECLQEEIRVFKKNEEATYDMLALYELLIQDTYVYNLIGITLIEKLIKDLEDPEVTISYKDNNLNGILSSLTDQFYTILRKYKNIEECEECCDGFNMSYKEFIAQRDISSLLYRKEDIVFNLIIALVSKSIHFVYKFLVSDIPLQSRLDMFAYVLGSYKSNYFSYFLDGFDKSYLSTEECEKAPSKIHEIVEAFNNNECRIFKVQDLVNHLLENKEYGLIRKLQNYGLDFNKCYWECESVNKILNNKTISIVGVLFNREKTLSSIHNFYESEGYLNVDKTVRKNNDLLILNYISFGELCDFIKLSHFEITEEKVRFIARMQMETIENYSITELNVIRENFRGKNRKIADTIIRKAKNKEEYKQMQKYANLFMNLVDIDKEISRKRKEENNLKQEKQHLEQKRQEFSTLLYNINEYAQENIPSRTLVKNIKFGK